MGTGVRKRALRKPVSLAEKPLEFNHEDNDPVIGLITMAAVDNTHRKRVMQIALTVWKMKRIDLRACRRAGSTGFN